MKYKFVIDRKLPSLNEYTKINRYNKYAGNKMKADCQSYIQGCIRYNLGNLKIEKPIVAHFTWVEENRRRDLDNIAFAKKFIFDALVNCGVLENDNTRYVKGWTERFEYKNSSMVIVELEEIEGETNED